MTEKWKATCKVLTALIVLLYATVACGMNPDLSAEIPPIQAQNEDPPAKPIASVPPPQPPANPEPLPSATIPPMIPREVMFQDSDCPADFPGLTANWGAGALECTYNWEGEFGVNDLELEIMQYNNPDDYERVLDIEINNYLPKELASKQPENDSTIESRYSDYTLETLEVSDNSYIILNTYKDIQTAGSPAPPLCGYGHGYFGVEGKFVVMLRMDSCDPENSKEEYRSVMTALKDAAEAAITRASANQAP